MEEEKVVATVLSDSSDDVSENFIEKFKPNYKFIDSVKFGEKHDLHKKDLEIEIDHYEGYKSLKPLPPSVDLRHLIEEVYDQGNIGSCVCNSVAMCYQMTVAAYNNKSTFHKYAWSYKQFRPSRLFLYAYARLLEGQSLKKDCGSSVLSGYRALIEYGAPDEKDWGYDYSLFRKPPPPSISNKAEQIHAPGYQKVKNNLNDIKHALANFQPVSFGAVLFKSFYSDDASQKGIINTPVKSSRDIMGGHCLTIIGYDDEKQSFIVKNSWGTSWGEQGYCYFPYEYATDEDLCGDFWSFMRI